VSNVKVANELGFCFGILMTFGNGGLGMVLWWMIPKNGCAMERKEELCEELNILSLE